MDKRVYYGAALTIIGFVVFTKTPLSASLLAFFILGIIPGTNIALPFWLLLCAYLLLGVFLMFWFSRQSLLIGEAAKPVAPVKAARTTRKKTSTRSKRATPKRSPRTAI